MKTWHAFAWLIITATLIAFIFHYLILIGFAIWLFCYLYLQLCQRYPRTMMFVSAFIRRHSLDRRLFRAIGLLEAGR
jgi:hypothetical protein